MAPTAAPRILLCAGDPVSAADIHRYLKEAGHIVEDHPLHGDGPSELPGYQLVVVDCDGDASGALQCCRRLRGRSDDGFLPILFVTADHAPTARLASLESGADAYLLRPFDPVELIAQAGALLRIKEGHDRLSEKSAEVQRVNKRLQQAYHQIDQELELARRLQQSFLPQALPVIPQIRLAVHYQPCGQVGGDFYDVFRLDERRLGFYVADAMGHGVPASLLTIFVKKGVRAKEIFGNQYRLVPPNEVLERLNHDLIEQALPEMPFVTMVYVLYDFVERSFQFARSGHPFPLYLPQSGAPEMLQAEGSLLGVFETRYLAQTRPLEPGDKVLLYTDGMDGAAYEDCSEGTTSLLACAERLKESPIEELVPRLARDLFARRPQTDDLTILGLEIPK